MFQPPIKATNKRDRNKDANRASNAIKYAIHATYARREKYRSSQILAMN
ncbi:hypothetical protein [Bradyrhizobium vignae]|uniref:Transposase n=1 Tax=Bradyrhizobium vignae TaxID=1549949 RepID=A0A2U3Q8K4_9BRAD|nr:hypothetical protein [Bradyrhizobium vignae]SPP97754.1 protein of unknown function [Bradyrhizobium vignae]